ncbi:uncharacterized protein LOC126779675 [Nymphalis io]|uniref:uncharacterized protein LOC126779675 n=1 Tax=Inachis io TaxID=171585 RepID=UPI0021689EB7|nr:uncharacterized protein LOC126779675 [Nymphalis io]
MEVAANVWKVKIFRRKNKEVDDKKEVNENANGTCSTCRYVKSKTCGSKEDGLRCKKSPPIPDHSFEDFKQSLSRDCSSCCGTVLEFFKEAFKTIQGNPKSRVCDVLGEMSDLLLSIANDCVLLLRRIIQCFCSSLR